MTDDKKPFNPNNKIFIIDIDVQVDKLLTACEEPDDLKNYWSSMLLDNCLIDIETAVHRELIRRGYFK